MVLSKIKKFGSLAAMGIVIAIVSLAIQYDQGLKNEEAFDEMKKIIDSSTILQPTSVILKSKEPYSTNTSIEFSGEASTGSIVSFLWNFGDGTTEENEQVNHTYQDSGIYKISLTVTDTNDLKNTSTEEITINSSSILDSDDPTKSINKSYIISILKDTNKPGCEKSNSCYAPTSLEIRISDTVSWMNQDNIHHTITSGTPTNGPSGVFDSGLISSDSTFEHTFLAKGNIDYFCLIHPWAQGTIIVK